MVNKLYSDENLFDAGTRPAKLIPGAIQLKYGQLEIGECDYPALRMDIYTRNVDGVKLIEHCHVTDNKDRSPRYDGEYNVNCSWCYLGYTHSVKAHNASI